MIVINRNEHGPRTRSRKRRRLWRKNGRGFDFGFERLQRGRNDLAAQLAIQLSWQARVAARMRNRHRFDDAAGTDLFRHRVHRRNRRHRETRSVQFFANHSAAATTGPSRGDKQDAVDAVLF